jgi:hypothetical protein
MGFGPAARIDEMQRLVLYILSVARIAANGIIRLLI